MKIFNNTYPLHKLYGFLLLNTSLIVFTPSLMSLIDAHSLARVSFEVVLSFVLSLCGLVLSILFILRKKIAIHLLTILLGATILILTIYMVYIMVDMFPFKQVEATLFILNAFGFFIAEAVLGLLIIHSKKLSDEFEGYR